MDEEKKLDCRMLKPNKLTYDYTPECMEKVKKIVEKCVKAIYSGKKTYRTEKNQGDNSMIIEIMKPATSVKMVGMFKFLPKELQHVVHDKKEAKALNYDSEIRKALADFMLAHDGLYTNTECCFIPNDIRTCLLAISNGEPSKYKMPFRTWFYKSERQLYAN
jgi:hypothetical protein